MLMIFLTIAITNHKHSHVMHFTFPQKWSWGRFGILGGNFMLSLWLIASEYYLSHPLGLQWPLCFVCGSWVILETVENIVDESLCSCTLTKRSNISWTKLADDNSSARQWRAIKSRSVFSLTHWIKRLRIRGLLTSIKTIVHTSYFPNISHVSFFLSRRVHFLGKISCSARSSTFSLNLEFTKEKLCLRFHHRFGWIRDEV